MAQDYQSVGQLSAEAEAISQEHTGWNDDVVTPLGQQQTEHDYSFRSDRANHQLYGLNGGEPIAAHTEPPMAGRQVQPFDDTKESTS
jgi:hypothetical protein